MIITMVMSRTVTLPSAIVQNGNGRANRRVQALLVVDEGNIGYACPIQF